MRIPQLDLIILMRKRIVVVALVIVTVISLLLGRLFWIQILSPRRYSSEHIDLVASSVTHRQNGLELDSGRGDIYDRNGQTLTGETIPALAFFHPDPNNRKELIPLVPQNKLEQLLAILHTTNESWQAFAANLSKSAFWKNPGQEEPMALSEQQMRQIEDLQLENAAIVTYKKRYQQTPLASQLIGYVGQNPLRIESTFAQELKRGLLATDSKIGGAGLEKSFQRWLLGLGKTSLTYYVDGKERYIEGIGQRMMKIDNEHYPLQVMSTLDKNIQQQLENFMQKAGIEKGAAVILDTKTADIVAMASFPKFDPNHVHLEEGSWSNLALKQTVPGSIYKTVIAAAALEEGVVTLRELFECDGDLGKFDFHCWKEGGHGILTLEEAFADSCNIVFAKIAQRLTAEQIMHAAQKLGVLSTVGWQGKSTRETNDFKQLDGEEEGQLFIGGIPSRDTGVLVQSAIGQRDVRMSPLQAANLVVTLLNRGTVKAPRAVKEIRYQNGLMMERFPEQTIVPRSQGISAQTSRFLLEGMREVVTHGTAQALLGGKWDLAGKTGTAEVFKNGKSLENQWFIGYGPVKNPRYAMAIVAEEVKPNYPNQVLPVFKALMNELANAPLQSK
ncbi:penicillin-binding protein 2 [Paenibacillus sp. N1-5-1-14]|uniref:peptidoglycan D,D-transpeptidase FtsI family protein n=1 Tax=Paenibacillus radicibacter TaxID=2972488 RepID=UPI002158CF20|nr:penicillin-binding protein 2 [Paenibacillus radicibacter]MCR8644073.1 penicillin-binding protein 2 [Paenibacillus radicibacter]